MGLHVDEAFNDALALAEELGGACELGTHRRGEATFAQCDYVACTAADGDENCEDLEPTGLTLGSEPVFIVSIGLEATGPAARLTQISIVFDGDADAVAESLVRKYGPPGDTTANPGQSWSNSRRLFWREGDANLSLLKNRRMIMLTTNRSSRAVGQKPH
jgi:hypothetical protein